MMETDMDVHHHNAPLPIAALSTMADSLLGLGTSKKVGSNMVGSGEAFQLSKEDMSRLTEQLQKSIRQTDNFNKLKNQIEMTDTSKGLRIELLESEAGTFFDSGNAVPSANGKELLEMQPGNWANCPTRFPSKATQIPDLYWQGQL